MHTVQKEIGLQR